MSYRNANYSAFYVSEPYKVVISLFRNKIQMPKSKMSVNKLAGGKHETIYI